jgi:hypothetical protein
MSRVAVLAAGGCLALLPGCGGGGDDTPSTSAQERAAIAVDPVVACLRKEVGKDGEVSTADRGLDDVARKAALGGAVVRFEVTDVTPEGTNRAVIAFERSNGAAGETEKRYRSVYEALGGSPEGRLVRKDNAVVAYGSRPSVSEREAIERCVRPA